MALFGLGFASNLQSLLVDARDAEHAIEMGTAIAEGEKPSRVRGPLPPGLVAMGLFTEPEDDEDADVIVLDPFPHVEEYLEKLDAELTGEASEVRATCASEADSQDGQEVVRCELAPGHEGAHRATTSTGVVESWATA